MFVLQTEMEDVFGRLVQSNFIWLKFLFSLNLWKPYDDTLCTHTYTHTQRPHRTCRSITLGMRSRPGWEQETHSLRSKESDPEKQRHHAHPSCTILILYRYSSICHIHKRKSSFRFLSGWFHIDPSVSSPKKTKRMVMLHSGWRWSSPNLALMWP